MILVNPGKALIDKISLRGIQIADIKDVDELIHRGCATFVESVAHFKTLSGEKYTRVHIHDDKIAYFSYSKSDYDDKIYSKLDLAVQHDEETDNLNCDDVDGLNERISNAI